MQSPNKYKSLVCVFGSDTEIVSCPHASRECISFSDASCCEAHCGGLGHWLRPLLRDSIADTRMRQAGARPMRHRLHSGNPYGNLCPSACISPPTLTGPPWLAPPSLITEHHDESLSLNHHDSADHHDSLSLNHHDDSVDRRVKYNPCQSPLHMPDGVT